MATPDDPFPAIIAKHWEDRTTRLAYADWLEERNDRRFEVIRVCEAMRDVPVWSDEYWQLKSRRNVLWRACSLEWLEATGYDGSYYDPIFRDGVPTGWKERWRLIREFTERWHGMALPDVGSQAEEVQAAEERLGLELPPSVKEFIAYSHDLKLAGTPAFDPLRSPSLFHCALYHLDDLDVPPALSLLHYTLSDGALCVFNHHLGEPDPPTHFFSPQRALDFDGEPPDRETLVREAVMDWEATLSLSVFSGLFIDLPTAGMKEGLGLESLLGRLASDFSVHARFDDAEIFERPELLVYLSGPKTPFRGNRTLYVVARLPVSRDLIPPYLLEPTHPQEMVSGIFGPEDWQRQQADVSGLPVEQHFRRWRSVLRREVENRAEAERRLPIPPAEHLPHYDGGEDIPF